MSEGIWHLAFGICARKIECSIKNHRVFDSTISHGSLGGISKCLFGVIE